jgi:hypothetical protein
VGGSQEKEKSHPGPPAAGKPPAMGKSEEAYPRCQKKSEEKRMGESPMADNGSVGDGPAENENVHIRQNRTEDAEKPEKGSFLPRQDYPGSGDPQESVRKSRRHSRP